MGIADRLIEDVGLRRGVSRLTPEIIEKTVNAVISGETGARLKAYAETCMRCGLCAEACHFSLSHPGDPSYTPAGKVHQTMGVLLKTGGKVDPDFVYSMRSWPTPNAICAAAACTTVPSAWTPAT